MVSMSKETAGESASCRDKNKIIFFYMSYFLVMQTSPGMQRLCRRHQSMMIVPVTAAKRQIPIRCNGQITSTVAVTHIAVSHFNTNELQLSVVLLPPAVTQFSMTGGNFRKFQAC